MPRPLYNTTQLPKQLREELGISVPTNGRRGARRHNAPLSRKEQRKATRTNNKRTLSVQQGKWSQGAVRDDKGNMRSTPSVTGRVNGKLKQTAKLNAAKAPNSILKGQRKIIDESEVESDEGADEDEEGGFSDLLDENEGDEQEDDNSEESDKNGRRNSAVRTRISRAVEAKLAEDDAEISSLEKRLGIKGKKGKLPQSFYDEGLADLLGDPSGSDSEDESRKRKREGDEWLQRKRLKAQAAAREARKGMDTASDSGSEEASESEGSDGSGGSSEGGNLGNEFEGFEDEDPENSPPKPKRRENPYVAPVVAVDTVSRKYIPPSLRAPAASEVESVARLRRQAQGHLNKLSEANLVSILRDVEKLYQDYPRHSVTSTLIDLLMDMIYNPSILQDTFIILHAGFIAAMYKVLGMDFGAEFVERIVKRFDDDYQRKDGGLGKQPINAISLLSHLYNFHVLGCSLIFDYIRLFLEEINEMNTELLLKIVRNSGPQLRQDDPSSLKDIILLIQPAVSQIGEGALSARTKFMIETMTDLKNNRLKTGVTASSILSEHITRTRKILGSLNNSRTLRASEPLRIGRADIHNSSRKGKWWLVGASWKNDDPTTKSASAVLDAMAALPDTLADDIGGDEVDLAQLARAHRMNTDVRRSIFVAIMSAADCRDAHTRLAKLRLKRNQEGEIPRVVLHCAMEEEAHNPYYTLIARKLCGERRMKMAFMFSLWDVFKRMGEKGDLEEGSDADVDGDGDNTVTSKAIVNLAKMFGSMVADGALTLGILKVLEFAYLQPKTKTFVELLLVTVMVQTQQKRLKKMKQNEKAPSVADDGADETEFDEKALADVFLRTRETPQIVPRLIYFIRKVVVKTDIVVSKREKRIVKWGNKVALDTLRVVSRAVDNS
ncbi:nuclear protein [Histoplasma capsulatum var. duboisii H88]|uniref:Nuclear protein n=1 Tax=Ajellomyces capsulatus (strain H88) TaxID=544711 RepID=F0UFD8_AJEC8|nr:nuclear protein [Histoplasma capsulatum var. duboisii H88]QSS55720.1 nuclear protein [Histoplasma capsulatum var. duboisii H88]